jgi:hypothetical protein
MSTLHLPDEVVELLKGWPQVGVVEQAFPFITIDDSGFPNAALLSRSEVEPRAGNDYVAAVLASRRTRANLARTGKATLIAIGPVTAHYLKLIAVNVLSGADRDAYLFGIAEHKADSLGIPLSPITFRTTDEIARAERWLASRSELDRILATPIEGGPTAFTPTPPTTSGPHDA